MVFRVLSVLPQWIGLASDAAQRNKAASALYEQVIEAARTPTFYADWNVPDSVEGRYEMLSLHAFLLMRRLKEGEPAQDKLAQALFDHMFADMDHSLREQGVGDLRVGKKVRGLAEDFFGRIAAYDHALNEQDLDELTAGISRNVFQQEELVPEARRLATYAMAADKALCEQTADALGQGQVSFPPPAEMEEN